MSPIIIPLPFGRRRREEEDVAATTPAPEPGTAAEPAVTVAPPPESIVAAPTPIAPEPAAAPPLTLPPVPAAPSTIASVVEPSDLPAAPAFTPGERAAPAEDFVPVAEAVRAAYRQPVPAPPAGPTMAERLAELSAFDHVVLSWVDEDGYPVNVAAQVEIAPEQGTIRFSPPAGFRVRPGSRVAFTGSHLRPLPSGGFDERRHLTVWGAAVSRPRGRFVATAERAWAWADSQLALPAVYERDLPKARRYYERLSAARGVTVRPRLPAGLLLMRATRAPFLSATLVPVVLGLAVAARVGRFDLLSAVLTVLAACAVHLGLNAANDVFDTLHGADDANSTPTKFIGGSRVIQNALVSMRGQTLIAVLCYAVSGVIGLALILMRGSLTLVLLVVVGVFISLAYTAPPFKLVYRGLGEIATAIGFGPVMLLGAYLVQSGGSVTPEAFVASIPVGLLVAMILYVNEIPDRRGDARVGKRTLPVRWSKVDVITGFDVAAGASFVVVVAGAIVGVLPFTTLLALAAVPLAMVVHRGLVDYYDEPYALMSAMANNIRLHLVTGLLLFAGYMLAIVDQAALGRTPFLR